MALRLKPTVVLAAVLLLTGIGLLWAAVVAADGDFSLGGPRLAPVAVTAAWVVIAAFYLVRELRTPAPPSSEEEPEPVGWLAPLGVLVALVGFAVALEYAGFVVSAAVFIFVVARVLGSRSIVRDVIVAVLLPLVIYFPFTRLLDIFLPAGVFPL
jgi:putative tricarboxylic transport membrane protein